MKIVQNVVEAAPDGKSVSVTQILQPDDDMSVGELQDILRYELRTAGGRRFPGHFIIVLDADEGDDQ